MDKLTPATSPTTGFSIRRGFNRSTCLSLEAGWCPKETWMTINDFLYIASQGYDQIRLPVDEKVLWKPDGSRDEETFATIERLVSHARAAGLKVTVDACKTTDTARSSAWTTRTELKTIFGKPGRVEIMRKSGDYFPFLRNLARISGASA